MGQHARCRVPHGPGRPRLTTFHLVRHAAHGLLDRTLAGRMPGVALSGEGQAQAARLAASFPARNVAAVISSPVQRAQETAVPLAARFGQAVGTEEGLNEVDFGAWTGASFAELHGQPAWMAWNKVRSFAPTPGGESMLQVQARAVAAVTRLHQQYEDAELVLVSHSDVLKAVLAHFLGVPLDLFLRIRLDPASRSILVLFESDVRVDGVNLPPPAF